jgi:uncharacterized glyoxalase superfamily protein PhnB
MINELFPIITTDDCDPTIEQLRAAGVAITQEPVDQPWANAWCASSTRTGTR